MWIVKGVTYASAVFHLFDFCNFNFSNFLVDRRNENGLLGVCLNIKTLSRQYSYIEINFCKHIPWYPVHEFLRRDKEGLPLLLS